MNKNKRNSLIRIVFILLFINFILICPEVKADKGKVTRIGEEDRYATAAKVAVTNWSTSSNVVLVSGEGYADAISACTLAKQLDAPILLTNSASLNIRAKEALDSLKPKNIYVIGGDASISQSIREDLRKNYNLIELKGSSRYETNISVAEELVKLGVKSDKIMLVSGEGFADALSAAPAAAAKGEILLLGTNSTSEIKPVYDFLHNNNSKITVIGTKYVINDDIYNAIGASERIDGGKDRFETNLNILKVFEDSLKGDKLFIANASKDGYADALVASALAGKWTSPLTLMDGDTSESTKKAIDYVKNTVNTSTDLIAIGGVGVISDKLISDINEVVSGLQNGTASVASISSNGLNQIRIVFNREVDKNTAENTGNYQIDGVGLDKMETSAYLEDDNKTLIITLSNAYDQYKSVVFTLKPFILDKNLNDNISMFEQKITFLDINNPKLEYVKVIGGKKLIVKFSEPVRMNMDALSEMRVDGNRITNLGIDTELTNFYGKSGVWADRVELYFYNHLEAGNHTFTIPDGVVGIRFDNAACIPMNATSVNFSINSVGDKPKIINITGDTSKGTIAITYDRPMDKRSTLTASNYNINGTRLSREDLTFEGGSEDKVVKIKGVGKLLYNGGEEVATVNDVRDSYDNKIDNNIGIGFYVPKDNVKLEITSIKMIDNKIVRVKFNKCVAYAYAVNKSNYNLINSDEVEITNKISEIKQANGLMMDDSDTYDIKFEKENALTDTKYTLTIKNIIDLNTIPNFMDDYTTEFSGIDNLAPYVTAIVKKFDEKQKLVIFFNEPMDRNSITNPLNYYFINGAGDTKPLPYNAEITDGFESRSVTICFPTNYVLEEGIDDSYVVKMGVAYVKDSSGNGLSGVSYCDKISTSYDEGPSIIPNTVKFTYEGDDIKVKFLLTNALYTLNIEDFNVEGYRPDGCTILGKSVILTFGDGIQNNVKINAIKAAGVKAELTIENTDSRDEAGRKLQAGSDTVYKMLLSPRTVQSLWTVDGKNSLISIQFDENIDSSIQALYDDDFIFTNQRTGERLKVENVTVDGTKLIYKFSSDSILVGDKINIYANNTSTNIHIRSEKDASGNYAQYVPSYDDLKIKVLVAN